MRPEGILLIGGEVRELGEEHLPLLAQRAGDQRDLRCAGEQGNH